MSRAWMLVVGALVIVCVEHASVRAEPTLFIPASGTSVGAKPITYVFPTSPAKQVIEVDSRGRALPFRAVMLPRMAFPTVAVELLERDVDEFTVSLVEIREHGRESVGEANYVIDPQKRSTSEVVEVDNAIRVIAPDSLSDVLVLELNASRGAFHVEWARGRTAFDDEETTRAIVPASASGRLIRLGSYHGDHASLQLSVEDDLFIAVSSPEFAQWTMASYPPRPAPARIVIAELETRQTADVPMAAPLSFGEPRGFSSLLTTLAIDSQVTRNVEKRGCAQRNRGRLTGFAVGLCLCALGFFAGFASRSSRSW